MEELYYNSYLEYFGGFCATCRELTRCQRACLAELVHTFYLRPTLHYDDVFQEIGLAASRRYRFRQTEPWQSALRYLNSLITYLFQGPMCQNHHERSLVLLEILSAV